MKRLVYLVGSVASVAALSWFGLPYLVNNEQESVSVTQGDVGRGAYLARASGCIACHTTANSAQALTGGAGLETPFGVFFAPNLTTDTTHGIGSWTLNDFATALRKGISPSGEPYYPAFPYSFYKSFSDQDIADLWAAFQTVPPAAVPDKPNELGFPFNIRQGIFAWQALFFDGLSERDPDQPTRPLDEKFSRGEYLVESATHCAACHTPRNLFGALDQSKAYAGTDQPLEGSGTIPAITPTALKQAGWSEKDLSYALQSGIKPDGDVFGGSMGEVVKEGTAYLQKSDLDAIAYYIFQREENPKK